MSIRQSRKRWVFTGAWTGEVIGPDLEVAAADLAVARGAVGVGEPAGTSQFLRSVAAEIGGGHGK